MLYSNYRIPIEPRQTPDGPFTGAIMGKFESGSRRFYLEASRSKVGHFIKGNRPDLLLSVERSDPSLHRWKVAKTFRQTTHLILSSRPSADHLHNTGIILAPRGQTLNLLDHATSGRLTRADWQIVLVEASPGDAFVVCIRTDHGTARSCYVVGDSEVIEATPEDFPSVYAKQLEHLDHIQRRHSTADIKGEWRNLLTPNLQGTPLF